MNRWQAQRSAWVQDSFTTYWLKCLWKTSQLLSTRDLTCKKTPPCLPRGQSHRRSIVIMMRHASNEDTWTWTQEKLKLKFDVVLLPGSIFAGAADILNFRMRALFKRPRRSSKNQTRSRPQSGRRRRRMHTNWQKRSRKINLKFLAGGVPALTVENRFQALPETSNRRFSLAEISGTGLICDWQNFWEKKKKLIYRNNAMWQVGKRNKDLSRKAPYVSERPHMFQKGPLCFKRTPYVWKRDPYVAHMLCFLKDFLPHMLKMLHMLQTRSPYVAHMQPICSPYVSAAVVIASFVNLCYNYEGAM